MKEEVSFGDNQAGNILTSAVKLGIFIQGSVGFYSLWEPTSWLQLAVLMS